MLGAPNADGADSGAEKPIGYSWNVSYRLVQGSWP
jgi:hypothetical protein